LEEEIDGWKKTPEVDAEFCWAGGEEREKEFGEKEREEEGENGSAE
jgi:hypothetical protein